METHTKYVSYLVVYKVCLKQQILQGMMCVWLHAYLTTWNRTNGTPGRGGGVRKQYQKIKIIGLSKRSPYKKFNVHPPTHLPNQGVF